MYAIVISDDERFSTRVRQVLLLQGIQCEVTKQVGPDVGVVQAKDIQNDLIIVVLGSSPQVSLDLIEQMKENTTAHILAVGPTTDTKLVLRALRLGADDFVDEAELETELESVLSNWRAKRATARHEGRLITVLAPSGGSGSSTLAVNIATELARVHKKSAIIDLKLRSGDLSALLDLKPTFTLADLCRNSSRIDEVLFERTLVHHKCGLALLASPNSIVDVVHVDPEGVRKALIMARTTFPYVVVDLDHNFGEEQLVALRQADVILLVFRLDFASLRNTRRTLDYLQELGIDPGCVRLIVNRFGQPQEVPAQKAEEALGLKIDHFIPDDVKQINRANNNGVPVVLCAPSAKVSKSVARLAVSVNGRHKAP